jgi:hypothetical protein
MSAFSLPIPPRALTGLSSPAYGTLRYRLIKARDFGTQFKPRYIFGARTLI